MVLVIVASCLWAPVPTPVATPVATPDPVAVPNADADPVAIELSQIEPTQSLFSCDATCSTSALLEASS
jgi:hypothetical protein